MPSLARTSRRSACALLAAISLATLLALTAMSATALAASISPGNFQKELTEGAPETTQTTSTATTATTSEGESHNSGSVVTVVIVVGAALLLGVAFVIMRDARRVAPAGEAEVVQGSTARHSEAALRKRRAKAKEARRQRKRNR